MTEIIEPSGSVIPGTALVPYVHPTLTNKTPVVWPVLVSSFRAWAILMIEWVSLRYIEHAPAWAYIASGSIALTMLAIIENREWLNFRGRQYFMVSAIFLFVMWLVVIVAAYVQERNEPEDPSSPAVIDLQTKLAAALRERDIAVFQRDNVRRESGDNSSSKPIPPIPTSVGADEIDERIEAWRSVAGLLSELPAILDDGDAIVDNLKKGDRASMIADVGNFRNEYGNFLDRLSNIQNANGQLSDLSAVNTTATSKLTLYALNLANEINQKKIGSALITYVNPFDRQIKILREWINSSKNVADPSISDLLVLKKSGTIKMTGS